MLTTLKTVANSCYSALFLILLVGVTACTPKGPKALMEGERLLQEGKPAEALVQLQLATELLPQNAQAWNHLGLAYHQTGKLEDAAQAYNHALQLDRNLVAVRYNLGTLMLDHGDAARALNEFKTFNLLNPESVEGHLQQGTTHLRLQQWNEAEAAFSKVQQLSKNHPEALNGLGLVLIQRQRLRDAVTYFNAALQQDPNFAPAHLNLAVIYHQHLTNYPLALNQYRAYLASQPTPADAAAVSTVVKQLEALVPGAAQASTSSRPVSIAAVAAATRNTPAPTTAAPEPSPTVTEAPKPTTATVASTPTKPVVEPPTVTLPPPPTVKPEAPKQMAKAEPIRTEPKAVAVKPAPTPAPVTPPTTTKPPAPVVQTTRPPTQAQAIPVTPVETAAATQDAAPTEPAEPEEKPGFFQRMNPLNFFRSKPKPPTPLSDTQTKVPATPRQVAKATPPPEPAPAALPAPTSAPVVVAPVVIKPPPIPRYPYLKPGPFAEGDRKAAQVSFDQALAAQKVRNWKDAIAGYRRAATADPSYFEAYYNLGWTAYEAKDIRMALVAYEHALAVQPQSFDARYNFALTLQQAGYPQDAADEYRQLTKDFPERAQPHLMLASLLSSRLRDKEGARIHYQKVLELEPNHPQATEIRYWFRANQ